MKPSTRARPRKLAALAVLLAAASCSDVLSATPPATQVSDEADPGAQRAEDRPADGRVVDAEIEPYRIELLELAFDAASSVPVEPHIKTRSREQERVADACFELGLPRRALAQAPQIRDWRRGAVYAAYAVWCAERGLTEDLETCLSLAEQVAQFEPTAQAQQWRRDRIRVRLAEAWLWLGDDEQAVEHQQGLVDSEAGKQGRVMASKLAPEHFDAKLAELDAVREGAAFDVVRNLIDNYVRLYDRFYADAARREALAERVLRPDDTLPRQVRLEAILALVETALRHDDAGRARELIEVAAALRNSSDWLPETGTRWLAEIAALRFAAGDEDAAAQELAAALALYEESRERIVDIWRAGALRPLAEAWAKTGDAETARLLYARALEEGVLNPNSVPRAEDLVATCLSMALHGVEPDAALWTRLWAVRAALGDPW